MTDHKNRCAWAGSAEDYVCYHDEEWGRPIFDDNRLFEKLCLEGFQSGLSWLTILRKRENFRKAFHGFDIAKVAKMGEREVARLLQDTGIVRHRGKIESSINNAKRALELKQEFGSLAAYVWSFEPRPEERPDRLTWEVLKTMAQTDASRALSKDLRKRSWSFVGPTTVYAFMQAMGLVNDHVEECFCRVQCEEERQKLKRPTH